MTEEDATPLLFEDPSAVAASDLIVKTQSGQWVDLVVQVEGPIAQPHPLHKHSNKGFIIGGGTGSWNWSSVAEAEAALPAGTFNFQTAPYRDGTTTQPAEGSNAWVVIRYQVVNPGAFLFHCHMQTHLSGGMAIALMDGVDKWPSVPSAYKNGNGETSQKLRLKQRIRPLSG